MYYHRECISNQKCTALVLLLFKSITQWHLCVCVCVCVCVLMKVHVLELAKTKCRQYVYRSCSQQYWFISVAVDLVRRSVDVPEKKYLVNRGVVTETQSNMGMATVGTNSTVYHAIK